jgi:hypothetical protein
MVTARLPDDRLCAELQAREPEWERGGISAVTASPIF